MAKYIAFSTRSEAEAICAHMHNMGFKGEILPACGQVRTYVSDDAIGNYNRLLDVLTRIM